MQIKPFFQGQREGRVKIVTGTGGIDCFCRRRGHLIEFVTGRVVGTLLTAGND